MAETMLILGTVMGVGSAISTGNQQKKTAEHNASMYEQQAANISKQQQINSQQYRIQKSNLSGDAAAKAGASGVRISGSVAKSISNSLTQLGIDENYNNFNLETQRNTALSNASFERYQGDQAITSSFLKAGTALMSGGNDYYSKYWKTPQKTTTTTTSTPKITP